MKTSQTLVHNSIHLLYLILTHRASISPARNQLRSRYQIIGELYLKSPGLFKFASSTLLILPCLSQGNLSKGHGPCFLLTSHTSWLTLLLCCFPIWSWVVWYAPFPGKHNNSSFKGSCLYICHFAISDENKLPGTNQSAWLLLISDNWKETLSVIFTENWIAILSWLSCWMNDLLVSIATYDA